MNPGYCLKAMFDSIFLDPMKHKGHTECHLHLALATFDRRTETDFERNPNRSSHIKPTPCQQTTLNDRCLHASGSNTTDDHCDMMIRLEML